MLSDVEAVDISFHNGLEYVMNNDPVDLDLTFSVLEETFGDVRMNGLDLNFTSWRRLSVKAKGTHSLWNIAD